MRLLKRFVRTTVIMWSHQAIIACTLLVFSMTAMADALERRQAKRMHDRLAGVPPEESVLDDMETALMAGNDVDAALIAIDNKAFYNITLKNFAAPWSNRERTLFTPLNDYTATVIGMVRDETPFNELLSANLLYVGDPALGLPNYSMTDNNHYQSLEDRGINLKSRLQAVTQSSVTDLPANATAGVMTTRAAAEAFFIAGTNRAMFRFTLLNHLCNDLEQVKDTSYSPDRIRQDPYNRSITLMQIPLSMDSSLRMTAGTTTGVVVKTHYWAGTATCLVRVPGLNQWEGNSPTAKPLQVAR